MDMGTFRGILTAVLLVLFVGICVYAWRRGRKGGFDRAAQMPLEDDTRPPQSEINKEQSS